MLAPCLLTQIDGKQIAIDAYDVCTIAEIDEGIQVEYVIADKSNTVTINGDFDKIVDILVDAHNKADSKYHREEGDEWKH